MTNQIGTGTRNLGVNVPTDELGALKKLASEMGISFSNLLRGIIIKGTAEVSPKTARELIEIRRKYYGAAFLFIICFSVASSWVYGDDDSMRRARTMRVRTVRCSKTGENKIETEFV